MLTTFSSLETLPLISETVSVALLTTLRASISWLSAVFLASAASLAATSAFLKSSSAVGCLAISLSNVSFAKLASVWAALETSLACDNSVDLEAICVFVSLITFALSLTA